MTIRKFEGHKSAAARVRTFDDGSRELISYSTSVISIDTEGWMTVNGLYSRTTIKHIGWFMRELGYTYQFAKQLYTDGYKYNLFTGEVERA